MVALTNNKPGIETKFINGPIVVNASRKRTQSGIFGMKGLIHALGAGNILQDDIPSIVNIFEFYLPNPCYQIRWDTDLSLKNNNFLSLMRNFYEDTRKRFEKNCEMYVEGLPGIGNTSFCFLYSNLEGKIELPFNRFLEEKSFNEEVNLKQPDLIRINNPYFHFAYALNDKKAIPELLDRLTIESRLDLSEQLSPLIQQTHRNKLEDISVNGLHTVIKDILSRYKTEKQTKQE